MYAAITGVVVVTHETGAAGGGEWLVRLVETATVAHELGLAYPAEVE